MSDNDNGFYSPLFNKNRLSMQLSRISEPSSAVIDDGRSTCSSSPTSVYSTISHQHQDSYESGVAYTKYKGGNGNDNSEISSIISNGMSKEHKLYHSSSLRSNNNIHSVELSPTDANFNIEAHSTSILTSSSLVTVSDSHAHKNTSAVELPDTPSILYPLNNDENDSDEKTCNVEVVSSKSDFYIRGGRAGFWRDLWRMNIIKDGKPTPKFWLIFIGLLALLLLIVIPVVVISNQPHSSPANNGTTNTDNNGTTNTDNNGTTNTDNNGTTNTDNNGTTNTDNNGTTGTNDNGTANTENETVNTNINGTSTR
ncbi:15681_t:CDS:2 [Acaulospora colombiana]|uniref:15681_t:CDS:1 n=1 Tax=Acaulospora colombiana TaxID=27376 RepID=A0ACA9PIM0_9GLOM|nr:15681_t:CDS:2 [Acaulospora colombiana]